MNKEKEIESKYKVCTKDLFKSQEDFDKELELIESDMFGIDDFKGKVCLSAESLLSVLSFDSSISLRLNSLYIYSHVNVDLDLSDNSSNENFGKVMNLYNEYAAMSAYIVPELLENDYEDIKKMIDNNSNLGEFELLIKSIFRAKDHTLSKVEEELIAKMSDAMRVPEDAMSKLTDVDLKFNDIKDARGKATKLTEANYNNFMIQDNQRVRKDAFNSLFGGYKSVNNALASLLSSHVHGNNVLANIRKHSGSFEASLYANDVDTCVYRNLIDSINDNISLVHKRYSLRKKVLNVDTLRLYDLNAPIVKDINRSYSFDEARECVINSLSVLGDDYVNVIKKSFDENWIDVYPLDNKRGGAYCTCAYNTHPYVLLNYDDDIKDVSTLTHELGHALHYHYAMINNNYSNYDYSIFVAEVASQVNEILLIKYLLGKCDNKDEKLYLYNELISKFSGAVLRQTMFAEFELLIYEMDQNKEILTTDVFNDEYLKLVKKYHGDDVIIDDNIKYEWSRIPHFYYNFYTYQYATGYMASLFIAQDLIDKKEGALDAYIKFLSLGSTLSPVDSLKVTGVDFSDKKTFDKAFKIYGDTINEFIKIYEEE